MSALNGADGFRPIAKALEAKKPLRAMPGFRHRRSKTSEPGYVAPNRVCKLTDDQVMAILVLRPAGKNQHGERHWHAQAVALGYLVGVSANAIYSIWCGRSYKHLQPKPKTKTEEPKP